jgi:iron complex outermembrane receptor protein
MQMVRYRLSVGLSAIIAAGAVDSSANAAEEADALEEIVVTGTQIRGVTAVGSQVIGIGAVEIRESGRASTLDMLRSVPQITNLGFDESRTSGSQRAVANLTGGSAINLRGLGAEATLVLVDGRRPLPGGGEARWFDPNSIPSIALQRVEVVPDGSSAIYGSDAMTGVVNLITRRNYDGAETLLRYGGADGFDEVQAQQIIGKTFDRGSVMGAFEYYDRGNLSTADRTDLFNDAGSQAVAAYPLNFGPAAAPTSGFVDTDNDGFLDPGEQTGRPVVRQSNWRGADALPEQERRSAFLYGEFEITAALKIFGEGYYSKREFDRARAAATLSTSVPATNPYNLTGAPVTINYSWINDLGSLHDFGEQEVWQTVAGATLDMGPKWAANFYASYGEIEDARFRTGVNNAAIAAAVNSTSTATALNPFSNGTNGYPSATVRQSVLDTIGAKDFLKPSVNLFETQLKVDGPLFSLPGGEVALAVGVQRQQLARTQVSIANSTTPNVSTFRTIYSPKLEREVNSFFAELYVPIVGDGNALPAVRSLSLSLAGRYDDYKDEQVSPAIDILDTDTTNPKFGITWQPLDGLKVRGSYGTSFRAPALGDYSYGAPTRIGTVQVSAPVAAAYSAPGLPIPAQPLSVNIQGGHTLGLTPEEARTWTVGLEFTPEGMDGLELSATYYNIRFEDQIAIPADTSSLQSLAYVNALVGSTSSLVLPGRGLAIFNPTTAQVQAYLAHGGAATAHISTVPEATLYGTGSAPGAGQTNPVYVLIDSLSNNTGILETDGIDFSVRYRWQSSWGNWTVGDTLTYVLSYDQALVSTSPLTDFLGQINFPLKFQTRAHLGWNLDNWSANAFVNYQDSYDNTAFRPTVKVDSFTTVDLTVAWDSGDLGAGNWLSNMVISLNGLNILDEEPPFARFAQGPAIQNFDSQNASAVGRFMALQVTKKW